MVLNAGGGKYIPNYQHLKVWALGLELDGNPSFMSCVVLRSYLPCVQLFVTPWTIQSMEFSRPECWSG